MNNQVEAKPKRKLRAVLVTLAALVVACAVAFFAYVNDYYHADETALAVLAEEGAFDEASRSAVVTVDDGVIAFVPQQPQAGLVFYPGGKVEYTAYAPLMKALAERGVLCLLVEMPFNLAVFDIDAASDAKALVTTEEWIDATRQSLSGLDLSTMATMPWYIGGHSLGGSMAASHVAGIADEYAGLVLFASYSTEQLSNNGFRVVSVYGSNDSVLNAEKYAENRENLGESASELVIEGGNHAQFGSYGAQEGDGEAAISAADQVNLAADFVCEAML